MNGGRPDHFTVDKPTFTTKLMVFCGVRSVLRHKYRDSQEVFHRRDGTFGLSVFRNVNMNRHRYHALLQYTVMPELRQWNGGNLDNLVWTQVKPFNITSVG